MNAKEYIEWLNNNSLSVKVKNFMPVLKRVYMECLSAKRKERILIITDKGYDGYRIAPVLAGGYYLTARELGLRAELFVQPVKTALDGAEQHVIDGLGKTRTEKNILILCMSNKLGEIKKVSKSFRRFVRETGQRFISATSLGTISDYHMNTFKNAIDIDYHALQNRQSVLKEILDKGNSIHVRTKLGTDLEINIKGKTAISNDGNYTAPGSGGNLPCGEVYIPPLGKRGADGRAVIDQTSRNMKGAVFLKDPMTIEVRKGRVVNIEGGREAELLEESLEYGEQRAKYPKNIRLLGEFGIGMNPNAKIMSSMIMDEKVLGTAHIGIGSNGWFGGDIKTIVHFDQVFKDPEIEVDGQPLNIKSKAF